MKAIDKTVDFFQDKGRKQIGFYTVGDRTHLVEFVTRNGFHEFEHEDDKKLVKANPQLPAIDVASLSVWIRSQGTKEAHKNAERLREEVKDHGATVRFFQALETGVYEVPVAAYAHLHRSFNHQIRQKATRFIDEDNGFELINLEPALQDLARMGIDPEKAYAYLEHVVNTMETGSAGLWANPHVLDRLKPVEDDYWMYGGVGALGLMYGLQFGASPGVAKVWQTGWGQWMPLVLLAAFMVLVLWRKR